MPNMLSALFHRPDAQAGRGRVALVTGASSGIGRATVLELLRCGFDVWGASRRVDRMDALRDQGMKVLAMDLTDDASIRTGVDTMLAGSGRVDVLVNNAGYGSFGAVETVPQDEARRQFEVNLFAPARLTQLLTPTMREQGSGRIINLSSVGGKVYEPLGAWYHATKFALEGLSDSLRLELAPFGIDVVLIEPGAITTEWAAIAHKFLLDHSTGTAYEDSARQKMRVFQRMESGRRGSTPDVVARKIAHAAVVECPAPRYPVGSGAGTIVRARRLLPDRVMDAVLARS